MLAAVDTAAHLCNFKLVEGALQNLVVVDHLILCVCIKFDLQLPHSDDLPDCNDECANNELQAYSGVLHTVIIHLVIQSLGAHVHL